MLELLFLSFTNLTSVPLSDIAPAAQRALRGDDRTGAGVLYVALAVSRVVGLTITGIVRPVERMAR
jgi:hypothetical protein